MSYSLDITTSDSYHTIACPGTTQVTVQVSNASIYIGFGEGGGGRGVAVYPPADEVLLPTTGGLERTCDSIRVKSYAVGVPANVKLTAR